MSVDVIGLDDYRVLPWCEIAYVVIGARVVTGTQAVPVMKLGLYRASTVGIHIELDLGDRAIGIIRITVWIPNYSF
jgi:hypothetical protein